MTPDLSPLTQLQETFYLGRWDFRALVKDLETTLPSAVVDPTALLKCMLLCRILWHEKHPDLPEMIKELLVGRDEWVEDAGLLLIPELIEIVMSFMRPEDIDFFVNMLAWDLYQVPSHIILLTRHFGWKELWDRIKESGDISSEYDEFIRAQYFTTHALSESLSRLTAEVLPKPTRDELRRLQQQLFDVTMSVVYVEGKTDRQILSTAWEKLFPAETAPFVIKECDPLAGQFGGGAGGAPMLAHLISTIRADSLYPVIAIFDGDKEGLDTFKRLPTHFDMDEGLQARIACHRKAAALALLPPPGRERYFEMENLPIEFCFGDQALSRRSSAGTGLTFRFPELEVRVKRHGAPLVSKETSTLPETREIIDGKTIFASEIVPALPSEEFEPFQPLFKRIGALVQALSGREVRTP